MAENKTRPTDRDVGAFLEAITDAQAREDCIRITAMMREITGKEPQMWGESIVGFGIYHYRYESGREGDAPLIGFSPRKQNLVLYLEYGFDKHTDLLQNLGKYKTGKVCLYIKRLTDVDQTTLRSLMERSVEQTIRNHLTVEA